MSHIKQKAKEKTMKDQLIKMKHIISIYYTNSSSEPVILNDGTKEYVNKNHLNFYGLKSEIDSRVDSLINQDSSVRISHAWIH